MGILLFEKNQKCYRTILKGSDRLTAELSPVTKKIDRYFLLNLKLIISLIIT